MSGTAKARGKRMFLNKHSRHFLTRNSSDRWKDRVLTEFCTVAGTPLALSCPWYRWTPESTTCSTKSAAAPLANIRFQWLLCVVLFARRGQQNYFWVAGRMVYGCTKPTEDAFCCLRLQESTVFGHVWPVNHDTVDSLSVKRELVGSLVVSWCQSSSWLQRTEILLAWTLVLELETLISLGILHWEECAVDTRLIVQITSIVVGSRVSWRTFGKNFLWEVTAASRPSFFFTPASRWVALACRRPSAEFSEKSCCYFGRMSSSMRIGAPQKAGAGKMRIRAFPVGFWHRHSLTQESDAFCLRALSGGLDVLPGYRCQHIVQFRSHPVTTWRRIGCVSVCGVQVLAEKTVFSDLDSSENGAVDSSYGCSKSPEYERTPIAVRNYTCSRLQ